MSVSDQYEFKQVQVRLKLAEAEPLYSTQPIDTPTRAVEIMAQVLAQMDREYCCVVNLDGANRPINYNVVSIGDTNQAHVPMQNVFKSAILQNSSAILLLHNHPSGSVKPSREDVIMTKKLIKVGRLMNIGLIDHIIVGGGDGSLYSFRNEMPQLFEVWRLAEAVREPNVKEVKKQGGRGSLKEKLEEKKAEVLQRRKAPLETIKEKKVRGMDISEQ